MFSKATFTRKAGYVIRGYRSFMICGWAHINTHMHRNCHRIGKATRTSTLSPSTLRRHHTGSKHWHGLLNRDGIRCSRNNDLTRQPRWFNLNRLGGKPATSTTSHTSRLGANHSYYEPEIRKSRRFRLRFCPTHGTIPPNNSESYDSTTSESNK